MSTQDSGPRVASHEPDPYLQWDGAYVLGALSSNERRGYEQHLAGCRACQRAVSELAGMPGLLSQVPLEDAGVLTGAAEQLDHEPPPDLGSTLLSRVRRRRRRVLLTVGSIAAALVLIFGGIGVLVSRDIIGTPTTYRVAFTPVAATAITANADVTPGSSATTIKLECQYARTGDTTAGSYEKVAVWVRDRSGHESEIFSWYPKHDKVMRPTATAPLPTWRIDALEIREVRSGELLLIAPLR